MNLDTSRPAVALDAPGREPTGLDLVAMLAARMRVDAKSPKPAPAETEAAEGPVRT